MTESRDKPAEPATTEAAPRPAAMRQVIGAVLWSFFGVRKHGAMHDDISRIRPHQVIIVGVVLAGLLVFALLGIVRLIMASASH